MVAPLKPTFFTYSSQGGYLTYTPILRKIWLSRGSTIYVYIVLYSSVVSNLG